MELDNEFLVSDSDWKWLLAHTDYREAELNDLLQGFFNSVYQCEKCTVTLCPPIPGFREEYPGGGIYRHQFEQWTGNVVMNIVFR